MRSAHIACEEANHGDADLVAERLAWAVDANCRTPRGTTPLIANIRGTCPNAATVRALLAAGADVTAMDGVGLTALDYARRKLSRLQSRRRPKPFKSPLLDENNQLKLSDDEQAELDRLHRELPASSRPGDWLSNEQTRVPRGR